MPSLSGTAWSPERQQTGDPFPLIASLACSQDKVRNVTSKHLVSQPCINPASGSVCLSRSQTHSPPVPTASAFQSGRQPPPPALPGRIPVRVVVPAYLFALRPEKSVSTCMYCSVPRPELPLSSPEPSKLVVHKRLILMTQNPSPTETGSPREGLQDAYPSAPQSPIGPPPSFSKQDILAFDGAG